MNLLQAIKQAHRLRCVPMEDVAWRDYCGIHPQWSCYQDAYYEALRACSKAYPILTKLLFWIHWI